MTTLTQFHLAFFNTTCTQKISTNHQTPKTYHRQTPLKIYPITPPHLNCTPAYPHSCPVPPIYPCLAVTKNVAENLVCIDTSILCSLSTESILLHSNFCIVSAFCSYLSSDFLTQKIMYDLFYHSSQMITKPHLKKQSPT